MSSAVSPAAGETPPGEDAHHLPSHGRGDPSWGRLRPCVRESESFSAPSAATRPAPAQAGTGSGEGQACGNSRRVLFQKDDGQVSRSRWRLAQVLPVLDVGRRAACALASYPRRHADGARARLCPREDAGQAPSGAVRGEGPAGPCERPAGRDVRLQTGTLRCRKVGAASPSRRLRVAGCGVPAQARGSGAHVLPLLAPPPKVPVASSWPSAPPATATPPCSGPNPPAGFIGTAGPFAPRLALRAGAQPAAGHAAVSESGAGPRGLVRA